MPVLGSEILNKTGKKIFLWVGFIIEANKIRQIPISSIADGKALALPVESHATFSSSFFKTKKPMKILFSAVFLGIKPVTSFLHCPYPRACAETHTSENCPIVMSQKTTDTSSCTYTRLAMSLFHPPSSLCSTFCPLLKVDHGFLQCFVPPQQF